MTSNMISAGVLPQSPPVAQSAIAVQEDALARPMYFVIRPNSSLSWRGNQLFFAGMAAVSFTIAGGFAWLGLWPVLPFAGLEMLILAFALYRCALRAEDREIVSIGADTIEVTVERRRLERRFRFNRVWARLVLIRAAHRGCRIVIRSHGREVEIGACLTDGERRQLANAIRRVL